MGTAADGLQLLGLVQRVRPVVVVADISVPALDGLVAIDRIKAIVPGAKVVILTQHHELMLAVEAFRRKASGYQVGHE